MKTDIKREGEKAPYENESFKKIETGEKGK